MRAELPRVHKKEQDSQEKVKPKIDVRAPKILHMKFRTQRFSKQNQLTNTLSFYAHKTSVTYMVTALDFTC